jgi:hypothetical protein
MVVLDATMEAFHRVSLSPRPAVPQPEAWAGPHALEGQKKNEQ